MSPDSTDRGAIDREDLRIIRNLVIQNQEGLERLAREEVSTDYGILGRLKRFYRDRTSEGPKVGTVTL